MYLDDFSRLTTQYGITCPNDLIVDGKIHRYGMSGDKGNPCWYVLHKLGDGVTYGAFGCWMRGIKERYCSHEEKILTKHQKNMLQQAKAEIENQLQQLQQEAKKRAQETWNKAETNFIDHPYLTVKAVKNFGLRIFHKTLLVPLFNSENELCSLQYITAEGEKRFLKHGITKGCYFIIGDINKETTLFIDEGYTTAATIHEATNCPVIVAFNANNLLPVAQTIRKKYPNHKIIICGDNDAFNENGNIGVIKATEAAKAINSGLVIPQFKNVETKPTDFNDLATLEGIEEVKKQLSNAEPSNKNNIPYGYIHDESGLYYIPFNKNGEPMPKVFISAPFAITARTRDVIGQNHGLLLEFKDADLRTHQWAMPKAILAGDGSECRANLLSMGLNTAVNRRAREKFTEYLLTVKPEKTALCVDKTGWHQGVFIFPDAAIGQTKNNEKIIFQSAKIDITGFNIKGTIADWRDAIGKYCAGNSRLILSVSSALAAPLLTLLQ